MIKKIIINTPNEQTNKFYQVQYLFLTVIVPIFIGENIIS